MTDRRGEARLLRGRLAALEARAAALGERAASGVPRMLAQVYNAGSLPAANGKFFACHPVEVTGTEGEGQVPSLGADTTQTIYVDVLGTKVPAAGDVLVCRRVDHRWVAWRGVAPTGPHNSCSNFPDIPSVLNLSAGAGAITAFMGCISAITFSATLTYGPPPAAMGGPGATIFNDNCAGGNTIVLPANGWFSPSQPCTTTTGTWYARFFISGCIATVQFITVTTGGVASSSGQGFAYSMPLAFAGGHFPLTSFWSRGQCASSGSYPMTISSGGGAGIPLTGTGVG